MTRRRSRIEKIVEANRLCDIANYLRSQGGSAYYADRHVVYPPDKIDALGGCKAGFLLLRQWHQDSDEVRQTGLLCSQPILMIDDSWLANVQGCPPHVYIVVSKPPGSSEESTPDGHDAPLDAFPLANELGEMLSGLSARRLEPQPEFEVEGAWLFAVGEFPRDLNPH